MLKLLFRSAIVVWLVVTAIVPQETNAISFTPINTAFAYLTTQAPKWGLTAADIEEAIVQTSFHSPHNESYHLGLQQTIHQIPIAGAEMYTHFNQQNELIALDNRFIPGLNAQLIPAKPKVSLPIILQSADAQQTLPPPKSAQAPEPSLIYLLHEGSLKLSWMVQRVSPDQQHYWNQYWDAQNGQFLYQEDWVQYEQPIYHVYPLPVESPNHGNRSYISPPFSNPSPYGWHDIDGLIGADYTHTRGNNVHAYADTNGDQQPDGLPGSEAQPDGGTNLQFDFPVNLEQPPNNYKKAAVTQLFYQTNQLHDLFYLYGFNESAGNFQQNNYSRGGRATDPILAEAEDAGRWNNASFTTPPDGQPGRMQMHWWNRTTPWRVSEFDNTITIHEFGHGVSTRMTGGANNVSCLFNEEQMGEGWSDWWATILTSTAETIATNGASARGIGTYVLGQPPSGNGIRPAPYSTDMTINPYTYANLAQFSPPHGTGFVWATILWDLNWAFVTQYGWEADWFNTTAEAGNIITFQLIVDSLTLQPCFPGFVDGRDAILIADQLTYQGANSCLIWDAFARRGLGYDADQGSSFELGDEIASFITHPACANLSISPKEQTVCAGDTPAFRITAGTRLSAPVALKLKNPPAAIPYSFDTNPIVNLPGAASLTFQIPPSNPTKQYPIQIELTTNNQISTTAMLTVEQTPPPAIQLLTPLSGTIHHSSTPYFSWSAVTPTHAYRFQLATDYAFTQIVYDREQTGNSISFTDPLLANQFYYWRVIASNSCGDRVSPTAVFLAPNSARISHIAELEIGSRVFIISDPIYLTSTTPIEDLNIWIDMEHQYVGDLIVRLLHVPTGEMIDLIHQPGVPESRFGCPSDNLLLILDDQANTAAEDRCAYPYPALFGSLRPLDLLSTFDLTNPAGYWRITIWDMYDEASDGILHQWGLDLIYPTVPADYSDLPVAYGIARHIESNPLFYLGTSWSADTIFAQNRDQNDGLTFRTNKKKITASIMLTGSGRFSCWFDWNNNQNFEETELLIDQFLTAGQHKRTIPLPPNPPPSVNIRCRLFDLTSYQISPTGDAIGGEVEDYFLPLHK